jgi:hypothetical protein
MRLPIALVAAVLVALPSFAATCQDKGGGYVDCSDGSFGNVQGDSLFLNRPDPNNPYGERRQQEIPCYRDSDGQLHCD